ncbi:MAG: hypothetical protein WC604_02955 [Candidatus Gracilibacteria bacterium]
MSQLVLERGASYKKSLLKRLIPARLLNFELSPYFLIVSLVAFVCLLTFTTLIFSTNEVTKGYTLNKLDAEQQELVKEREIKDMQLSKVRALDAIKSTSKVSKMARPKSVAYVHGDTVVVSR